MPVDPFSEIASGVMTDAGEHRARHNAVAAKLGGPASTPTAGTSLQASGTGTSKWVDSGRNVKAEGAAGNNSTDDSTVLGTVATAAKNAGHGGDALVFPRGGYRRLSSITDFWSVPTRRGPGRLSIPTDGTTFKIEPNRDDNWHLWVHPDGSDAADGLSSDYPFATLQRAFDVCKSFSGIVPGKLTIHLAAGTYTEGATWATGLPMQNPIVITGPDVGTSQPTAILDGDGASKRDGISFDQLSQFEVRHLKFVDWDSDTFASGVFAQNLSRVVTRNVWATGCSMGIQITNMVRASVEDGVMDTCGNGFKAIGFSHFTVSRTVFKDCTNLGALVQGSNGHFDYCQFLDNDAGTAALRLVALARAHLLECEFKRNNIGVLAEELSHWYDNGCTFYLNTADEQTVAPWINRGSIRYTADANIGTFPITTDLNTDAIAHTGTTSRTSVATFGDIVGGWFINENGKVVMEARGNTVGTGGNKTLEFRLAGSRIGVVQVISGAVDWLARCTLQPTGVDTQSYLLEFYVDGSAPVIKQGTHSFSVSGGTDRPLTLDVTLANSADTVNVLAHELRRTG